MQDTAISLPHRVKSSEKPFAQVIEVLEAQLGHITGEQLRQIAQSSTSAGQYAQAIQPFIGPSGFTVFIEIDHGLWISMFFKPLKAKLYVLGNPLFAKDMLTQDAAAGLYVPTRLYVYEDKQAVTQLAYDPLSGFVDQFHDPALTAIAKAVDEKLEALVDLAAG